MEYYIPYKKWEKAKWLSRYYIRRDLGNMVRFTSDSNVPYFVPGLDDFEKKWALGIFCAHHKINRVSETGNVSKVYWAFTKKFNEKNNSELYAIIKKIQKPKTKKYRQEKLFDF
jgi:hypothetical protein